MTNDLEKVIRSLAIYVLAGLVLGGASFAQQAKVKPVGRVVIVDSKGKIIGTTLGGLGIHNIEISGGSSLAVRSIVLLAVDQHLVPVAVGRDRFYGSGVFYFELENCAGAPWFPVITSTSEPPGLLSRVGIGPPGQTVYLQTDDAAPQSITIRSMLQPPLPCSNQTFHDIGALPTQPLVDLLTIFTPPFSLRAAP
ncbi:MAG: hypothetical protein A3H28_12935 [Acidobacteria bacterium RIFCSPLOWO2_02_FULL_61_28]|nr:MAG: hypothetical protein A3H28_12935 [Acidobacteria bacterium RIFCSPLOWO2_02_FULL_61_28]